MAGIEFRLPTYPSTALPASSTATAGRIARVGNSIWVDNGTAWSGETGAFFNVKDYGATGDGVTDDTSAIQAAHDALPSTGGTVLASAGTFLVSANLNLSKPVRIVGVGQGVTQFKRKANSVTTDANALLFKLSGAGPFIFKDLTIDGNGPNQSWGWITGNSFYKGISGDGNGAGPDTGPLVISNVTFQNISMTSAIPQGLGVNTFGVKTQLLDNVYFSACDCGVFVTQPFNTDPNQTVINNMVVLNPTAAGIELEGFGGVSINNLQVVATALTVGAMGIRCLTSARIRRVTVNNARFEKIGYIVSIGGGANAMSESAFSNLVAEGCAGSYNLSQADSSCTFDNLVAENCAAGGIPAATVFASLEIGGGAQSDHVHISGVRITNSDNDGIVFHGQGSIDGGEVRGSAVGTGVNFDSATIRGNSRISGLRGYNPVGVVTVAVPATTVAVAAVNYDRTFYITTTAAVTVVISNGPTIVLENAGLATVRVPAGQTLTPTYAGAAPTWVVEGE